MEPASFPLQIGLFGPMEVRVHGEPLPRLRSRKGLWLLALLVLRHGREVRREWLVETLWPESLPDEGFASLRQSLADLRRALGPEAARVEAPTQGTLRLELSGAGVDLLVFDAAIRAESPEALERAVALYRGPLLEGCAEIWVLGEREAREQAYLGALEALAARALADGDYAAAIECLRRGAAVQPLRQTLHRSLMQALAQTGQHQAAVEVYQDLRRRLHREYATGPDRDTTAHYHRLREQARALGPVANRQPAVGSGSGYTQP